MIRFIEVTSALKDGKKEKYLINTNTIESVVVEDEVCCLIFLDQKSLQFMKRPVMESYEEIKKLLIQPDLKTKKLVKNGEHI